MISENWSLYINIYIGNKTTMTTQLQTLMKSLTRDSSLKKNVVLSLLEEEEREFKQIETELKK